METKPLLYGLIGFFLGGLLVSVAAVTFDKPDLEARAASSSMAASMEGMSDSLQGKTGDAFDKTFLAEMIVHHEGAVEMARMAQKQAKHQQIRQLADDIITAQQRELDEMRQWQKDWGYDSNGSAGGADGGAGHGGHMMR